MGRFSARRVSRYSLAGPCSRLSFRGSIDLFREVPNENGQTKVAAALRLHSPSVGHCGFLQVDIADREDPLRTKTRIADVSGCDSITKSPAMSCTKKVLRESFGRNDFELRRLRRHTLRKTRRHASLRVGGLRFADRGGSARGRHRAWWRR